MISFKAFINAIHDAILAANDSLMQKNTGLLDKYFEAPDDEEETEDGGALSPKSVVIEYPRQTSRGIEYVEVHVPLITLVPLAMSEIKEAKLTTEFEIEIVDDEVQLNFRSGGSKGKLFGKKRESTFGRLEITISPQESSEGLKRLVEGYEKALKSQIPH